MTDLLPEFDDDARVWIYCFEEALDERSSIIVRELLQRLVAGWQSHGEPVKSGFALMYDQFAILCTAAQSASSGCSIDKSVHVFKNLKQDHNLNALAMDRIQYRDGAKIRSVTRAEFQRLVVAGQVTKDTRVFDNTVQTVGALRHGQWETTAENSWHAAAFDWNALS